MIFFRISRQIPEKSDVCCFSINFAKTNQKIAGISEICEKFKYPILIKFVQFYSMVSLVVMDITYQQSDPPIRRRIIYPDVKRRSHKKCHSSSKIHRILPDLLSSSRTWREFQILTGHQSIIVESAVAILAEVGGSLSFPVFQCPAMFVGSVWMRVES